MSSGERVDAVLKVSVCKFNRESDIRLSEWRIDKRRMFYASVTVQEQDAVGLVCLKNVKGRKLNKDRGWCCDISS